QSFGELVAVVSEQALSARDKLYLQFADEFERKFINQGLYEDRDIDTTLDLGWNLLRVLPEAELKRIDPATIKKWLPKNRGKNNQQMPDILPGARPTRMELIALRKRRNIAQGGQDLLR